MESTATSQLMLCPKGCGKMCNGKLGLAMHLRRTHGTTKVTIDKTYTAKKENHVQENPTAQHVTYIAGYIDHFLETYSRGAEIPTATLTRGLVEHLQRKTGR